MSKRDEYVAKLKNKLDEWNKDVDKLEAKSEHVKEEVKEKYHEELEVVKKQRDNARAKAMELIESGEEAWEELKVGVEQAWQKFTEAVDKAHSKF